MLAAIAEKAPIAGREALEAALAWLVRLADVEEAAMTDAMAYRWRQICDRAGLAADDPMRGRYAEAAA
jgi:hypothetical protein